MAGLIAQHDVEFRAEGFFHQFRQVITGRGDAVGAAFRRRGCVADVIHRFIGSVGAHVQQMVRSDRIADPAEFRPVESHLRLFGELLEVERRIDGADRQTIVFVHTVNLIGRDHRGGSGYVLDDDVRIAGNVLWHELGEHARIKVVGVARFGADDDRDGLALVERLRLRRSSDQQKAEEKKPTICHYYEDLLK